MDTVNETECGDTFGLFELYGLVWACMGCMGCMDCLGSIAHGCRYRHSLRQVSESPGNANKPGGLFLQKFSYKIKEK